MSEWDESTVDWNMRFSKDGVFDDKACPKTVSKAITLNDDDEEIEVVKCPFCHGLFAVDSSYLDQVCNEIHCPMCCEEVSIGDPVSKVTVRPEVRLP